MIARSRMGTVLALGSLAFGCDDPEPQAGPRATKGPEYAVINSDWTATSVSLLGIDGNVIEDNYISSGSAQAGLVTALSGDVVLPTRSGEDGVLVLIDRFKTDVITRIRLEDGKILGQVKTHTPADQDSDNAYSSNPNDYVYVDEHTAWVTRYQPNLDPEADDIDLGNDLLRIDPSAMERTDERIDLSMFDGKAKRKNPETGKEEEVDIYARPSRLLRIQKTLVVGLGRSAIDFKAAGQGMIALVDLESRKVQGVSLEGLRGCTDVNPVPKQEDLVLVVCTSVYGQERDGAGFAFVRVKDGKAKVERLWSAKDHPDDPANLQPATALSDHEIVAVVNDYTGEDVTRLLKLDLASEELTEVLTAEPGGTFDSVLFDERNQYLFVTDASVDADKAPTAGLHLLERQNDGSFEEIDLITPAADTGMPVRQIFQL